MVSTTAVQQAQSTTGKFEFNPAVGEFKPPSSLALNVLAKEFSPPAVQSSSINFDLYSSDDESPRASAKAAAPRKHAVVKKAAQVRLPPGLAQLKGLNIEAQVFVPPAPTKPTAPIRPPPGLSIGLRAGAQEFTPPPAPVWHCAVNLDDYTDDESDDDEPKEEVDLNQWRGLCGRLASPDIWSVDKLEADLVDSLPDFEDSEADTAEPSSHDDSETEAFSGSESP